MGETIKETPDEEFKKIQLKRLRNRAERLNKLLHIHGKSGPAGSPTILAGEIVMLLEAAIGYCGPIVMKFLGDKLLEYVRMRGYCCRQCGRQQTASASDVCTTCIVDNEALANEMEKRCNKK